MATSLETTLTVVGTEVMQHHPELHHYTDRGGLEGILRSNTIWATHFADLNDSAEIVHLREPLRADLVSRFEAILKRRRLSSLRIDRAIREAGGLRPSAASLADDLIQSLYQSAFELSDGPPTELGRTAGSPFIASFCAHTGEPYEIDNGLLSQWRGYGGREGFCLVLDTARLGALLGREFDASAYSHLNLHEAHYGFPDASPGELFPDLMATCERFVNSALDGEPQLGEGIAQFFAAATLFKHQGFHEEREVRAVAIPMTDRFRALVAAEHPDAELPPQKQMYKRPDGRRYVSFFEGLDEPLPIKRVIVGPSRNQEEHLEIARSICGDRIPVAASATPYKG